ncbi:hypothetical protein [uncultured Psychrobacter sp.]|mgnify:CR=1 FL=1|uniref:hypothetical protein n=1 Tax=uncultured Psychrobacter sp. TaxID=259303 RepID=UPI00262809FE|nr:hypothetical protein [uncultured Psychrobacter sp.]
MYNTHHSLYSYLTSMPIFRVLISILCVTLFFSSQSSYAAAPNPGAVCDSNFAQGSLTSSDYTNLVNSNNYVNIAGNSSGAIPLQIKMTRVESSSNTVLSSFEAFSAAGKTAINMKRNFPTVSDYTDINFEFRNSNTQQPLFLTNVAISAFDIDYSNNNNNRFYDYVKFTGVNADGNEILSVQQNIPSSFIANYQQEGLFTGGSNGRAFNCPARNLGTECQGSIQFPEPVKSVKIRYTNTGTIIQPPTTPTTQEVDIVIDNYCYAPPRSSYDITKTDSVSSIASNSMTNYVIKITNTGQTTLNSILLKDAAVTGLSKQSNIRCDSQDATNVCTSNQIPTVAQLEGAGFTVPSIAIGSSYSLVIPTTVTSASNTSVTNTATVSHPTIASKSASDTNSVTTSSGSGGSTTAPATCPAGHKMYYVGESSPPSYSPIAASKTLTWRDGVLQDKFTFSAGESSGNKVFNFRFTADDLSNSQGRTPPYYGNVNNATVNAINFVHTSPSIKNNNSVNLNVNRPTSRIGFKIQDLDSYGTGNSLAYAQQVTANGGQLTFSPSFHTILQNSTSTVVTAKDGENCGLNGCTIDATWGSTPADTEVSLIHRNARTLTDSAHAVGYSEFYFCLAPPKVVVKKELSGNRVNDNNTKRDQFEIKVTGGSVADNSITTTGTGATIANGTSSAITLLDNTTYTITERVMNGTTLGDIVNYDASYTCTNQTTGSNTVMPSGQTIYDATNKTRSFTLSNLDYADEIICTITNTPAVYTVSGNVFNDNGGITDSEANADNADITSPSSPYADNPNYFNGLFDTPLESGITGSTVSLVDCRAPSTVYASQAVSSTGSYQINLPVTTVNSNMNNICVIEERNGTDFPIRTTSPSKKIDIVANTFSYPNNNFGRVIAKNVALVLKKSQYINDCPATLNYASISDAATPLTGFSTAIIEGIAPGKCIAYKITATNRANTKIDNFIMKDVLQKKGTGGALVTSVLANPALATADYITGGGANSSPAIGENGTVRTKNLVLEPRSKRNFYFNTKYGTSQ